MHEFYIYDENTGEYLGKRMTSTQLPTWQKGVRVIRKESLPQESKNQVTRAPNEFKMRGKKLERLSQKDIEKMKRSKVVIIKKVIQ